MRAVPRMFILGSALGIAAGCGPDGAPPRADRVLRDTLANGAVRVRYAALPASAAVALHADLRIGALRGDPHATFGDVRGVAAGADGTIYVLDYQAAEVRAFAEDGRFLRVVAGRGEGPGEIAEANGILLGNEGTLWINDHGALDIVGVSTDGGEVDRFPMPVLSYGYVWEGTLDDAGRFWRRVSHRVGPEQEPEEGLNEGANRLYLRWYDPAAERSDSIYVGDATWRTFAILRPRSRTFRGVPFTPEILTAVDPAGGIWRAASGAYSVARLDEVGDTTLLIEAAVEPRPVTDEDRAAYVARIVESRPEARQPEARRSADAIAQLMPATKPVLASLSVGEEGRLWVGRVVEEGKRPLYDVFTRDGTRVYTVRLDFAGEPSAYVPLRVRDGLLYTVVRDSLDVQYVVRAPLPEG